MVTSLGKLNTPSGPPVYPALPSIYLGVPGSILKSTALTIALSLLTSALLPTLESPEGAFGGELWVPSRDSYPLSPTGKVNSPHQSPPSP